MLLLTDIFMISVMNFNQSSMSFAKSNYEPVLGKVRCEPITYRNYCDVDIGTPSDTIPSGIAFGGQSVVFEAQMNLQYCTAIWFTNAG